MQAISLDGVILFHSLWRALLQGSTVPATRPALPAELIDRIFRYAGCIVPSSSLTITCSTRIDVRSNGNLLAERWFSLPPFTREMLSKAAQIQLVTMSRHQGWVDEREHGSWSWFELALYPASAPSGKVPKKNSIGSDEVEMVWRSHYNPVDTGARVQPRPEQKYEGTLLGPEHEMWEYVEEGDVVGVRVCAVFPGWANTASWGEVRVWTCFEPVISL